MARTGWPGPFFAQLVSTEVFYGRMVRATVVVFVLPPPVPVMVIVWRPILVPELTVNCIVDVPEPGAAIDVGLKLTVTPAGWPDADKDMDELKPFTAAVVIVELPDLPQIAISAVGDALMVKFPGTGAVTVRVTVAVRVRPPPVPVTVIGYTPVAVLEATVMVMVEVPEPGAAVEAGLKLTVTPVGWPLADKPIDESNPPDTVVVIVDVPLLPCTTETEVGEAETAKFAGTEAVTVRVTVVVCVMLSPKPVTVIGYTPVAVLEATVMVIVEVPEPGAAVDEGLKLTVTPVGWPVADKAIDESNPPETALVIVDVPLLPCTTETEAGEAETVKLGADGVPARVLIRPAPFGLPQPVAKSYPATAE